MGPINNNSSWVQVMFPCRTSYKLSPKAMMTMRTTFTRPQLVNTASDRPSSVLLCSAQFRSRSDDCDGRGAVPSSGPRVSAGPIAVWCDALGFVPMAHVGDGGLPADPPRHRPGPGREGSRGR